MAMAKAGLSALLRDFIPLLKALAMPVLITVAGFSLLPYIPADRFALSALAVGVDNAMTTLFAVAWLSFLLSPSGRKVQWLPRWSRAHSIFFGYMLVIYLALLAHEDVTEAMLSQWPALGEAAGPLLTLSTALAIDLFHYSLALAFCALAVRQPGGPLWAWRMIGWSTLMKMFAFLTFTSVCLTSLGSFLTETSYDMVGDLRAPAAVLALPATLGNYASYAVKLAVFAFVYRHITGWQSEPDDRTLAVFD